MIFGSTSGVTSRLTLLSPSTWDDGNDRHYLEQYQAAKSAGSVLALCFSRAPETYHHWRVFTSGSEGVCIEFHPQSLIDALPNTVRSGDVSYVMVKDITANANDVERWPFLKRYPFRDEKEFRLLCSAPETSVMARSFTIPLEAVRRVTTSPWLPQALHESVKSLLRTIPGCDKLDIRKTTLVDNEQWKKAVPGPAVGAPDGEAAQDQL